MYYEKCYVLIDVSDKGNMFYGWGNQNQINSKHCLQVGLNHWQSNAIGERDYSVIRVLL